MNLSMPERLLKELEVDDPKDINLQLLCEACKLELEYAGDMSADAEILIAFDNSGIITINQNQNPLRQRFSIAHELGHWHLHKKQPLFSCQPSDGLALSQSIDQSAIDKEREADRFAANLLMPPYIFLRHVREVPEIGFASIEKLGGLFQTSIPATAIQTVNMGIHPIVIAVYSAGGVLCYFSRSSLISEKLWPAKVLSSGMYAFDVAADKVSRNGPVQAFDWFDSVDDDSEVFEESHYWNGQIMSIIRVDDERLHSD